MWFLIALIFINAAVDRTFLFEHRFTIAGLPISALDVLTVLSLIAALLAGSQQEPGSAHPLLKITLLLFGIGGLLATIGGLGNGAVPRWVITTARDMVTLPLVTFISYRLAANERRVKQLLYTVIWASVGSALTSLLFVSRATEDIAAGGSFNELRTTSVRGDIGIAAAAVLLFGMFSGNRVFARWLAFPLLIISVLGALSLPHRSAWLVAIITCGYAAFFLHRGDFVRKAGVTILTGFVLSIAVLIAVSAISKSTGRDYGRYIEERLSSFMPGNVSRQENHPWESRVPGIRRELELWLENPLMGRGFAIQTVDEVHHPDISGYRHNVWTNGLVEGGPAELAALLCVVFGMIVIGYRMVKTGGNRVFVLFGALASSMGIWSFLAASSSMTLNLQGPAIAVGSILGGMLRARSMQLAQVDEIPEDNQANYVDENGVEMSMVAGPEDEGY